MGTFQKGILGGFSGKVGTVVGFNWRGKDVMRSLPKHSHRVPTESQLWQRLKFTLVAHFLRPLRPILNLYFGQRAEYKSRRNLAVSYHLTHAVTGIHPDFTIDYQKVIISKGELQGFESPQAVPQSAAELLLSWADNSGQGQALADDMLVIVAYNPVRELFETRTAAAPRDAMAYTLKLPVSWVGDAIHCWAAFASANNKKVANSIYLGEITLV